MTEIEEKDFREDDVVFLPLKRVFAVDATFVVVVTANIVRFLKGFGLRKGLTRRGVINRGIMEIKFQCHTSSFFGLDF